jgi:hypothetical protein
MWSKVLRKDGVLKTERCVKGTRPIQHRLVYLRPSASRTCLSMHRAFPLRTPASSSISHSGQYECIHD